MADIGGHLSAKGAFVDTNNDGIVDGFAHTVKNAGNFSTFSLTNGVLSLAPSASGASIGGANTQVQFNDAGSLNGESTFTYNKTSNTLTIANVVISGDLTVSGTTTTVNTATLDIADNIITLNSDLGSGVAPSQNAGILINRGSATDVELVWDETNDRWDFDGYALASVGKVFGAGSGAVYTFTSDTDTGVEHTGTDQLGLLAGNTRVLMVNANGVHIAPGGATGAGSNQALLVDNIAIDTNTISSADTNGNIVLAPNGTGDVQVDADTLRVGDSGSDATITSNGAGDLTISTNGGTNSGYVKVEDGANNDILIIPNGTGKVGIGQLTPTEILHVDGNAIITGTLTVQGTTTTVSTTNTFVSDSVMTLNSGETANGVSGNVAGFEVDRGANSGVDNPLARFVFDDSDDKFKVQLETGSGAGTYAATGFIASTIEGTTGTFSGDVAVDTNVLKVDTSNNRVGINKTSPAVALDVVGAIAATTDLTVSGNAEVQGRLQAEIVTKVENSSGVTLPLGAAVYVSGTHAGGKPLVALADADGSSTYPVIGLIHDSSGIANSANGFVMVLGTVESIPASQFVGSNPSAGDLVYMSTTVGKLTVDVPTGSAKVQNVGVIAKTNVNVSGNSGTANILVQGPGRTTDLDTVRTVTAGGNTLADSETLAFTAGANVTISESAGAVTIASTDTNTFRTVTAGGNTLGASETLAFTAGSNVTITESGGSVTIAASGGGGGGGDEIVDADSDTKIQVEESSDEDKIRFDTAGTEAMIIDDSQRVGIGTSSPENPLHVKNTTTLTDAAYVARFQAAEGNVAVTRYGGVHINNDNTSPTDGAAWDTNRWQISQRDSNQLDIAYGTSSNTNIGASDNKLRIKTDGKVGINLGASDPSQALHVSGTIRQTGVTSNVLVADANGDIVAASNLTDAAFITPGNAGADAYVIVAPGNPSDWAAAPPATIQEAINRIGSALAGLTGPIP